MENRIGRSTASPTTQADEALRRVRAAQNPQTAGDIYVAAARADHNIHCTRCRDLTTESAANAATNAASIARRDRRQLGLRLTATRAVNI